jgi:hypothetical protein
MSLTEENVISLEDSKNLNFKVWGIDEAEDDVTTVAGTAGYKVLFELFDITAGEPGTKVHVLAEGTRPYAAFGDDKGSFRCGVCGVGGIANYNSATLSFTGFVAEKKYKFVATPIATTAGNTVDVTVPANVMGTPISFKVNVVNSTAIGSVKGLDVISKIAKNSFKISGKAGSVGVYDLSGRVVIEKALNGDLSLDMNKLNKGVYIIRANVDSKMLTKKVVVE